MENLEIITKKIFIEEAFGQMCEETLPLFQPPIYRPLKARSRTRLLFKYRSPLSGKTGGRQGTQSG